MERLARIRIRTTALAVAVAAVLGATRSTALATTIEVTIESDGVANDGHCSLREAVTNANTGQAMFAGAGECPPAAGDDTVVLRAGHYVLSRAGKSEDLNATGDLDILGTAPTTIALGIGKVTLRNVAAETGRFGPAASRITRRGQANRPPAR